MQFFTSRPRAVAVCATVAGAAALAVGVVHRSQNKGRKPGRTLVSLSSGTVAAAKERRVAAFISYCQADPFTEKAVTQLVDSLDAAGIYAIVDYRKDVASSWPMFLNRMFHDATKVVVVCDENYAQYAAVCDGNIQPDQKGKGVIEEYGNIQNMVYNKQNTGGWLAPVILRPNGKREHVPLGIQKFTYYTLDLAAADMGQGFQDLRDYLLNDQKPAFVAPMPAMKAGGALPGDDVAKQLPDGTIQLQPVKSAVPIAELLDNEAMIAKDWRENVQPMLDRIYRFRNQHPDFYQAFRQYKDDGPPEMDHIKPIEEARRVVRDFWRNVCRKYLNGLLPPDLMSPQQVWLTRGNTTRELVEPIDIANYYRLGLWKGWSKGNRHYMEANNRPEYFQFLELQFDRAYPDAKVEKEPTDYALAEAKAIEDSGQ